MDLCSLERNPFVGQRCDKDVGLLEVVKLGVRTFVDTKLKMNTRNQFALCTLTDAAYMVSMLLVVGYLVVIVVFVGVVFCRFVDCIAVVIINF